MQLSSTNLQQDLDVYLRARFTLIVLVTIEEERAIEMLKVVIEKKKQSLITWDVADGFRTVVGTEPPSGTNLDPLAALQEIERSETEGLFVLLDFHECWGYPNVKRKLRTLARRLKSKRKSIMVLCPGTPIPEELKNDAVVIELPLPNGADLDQVLGGLLKTPGLSVRLNDEERDKLVHAGIGLTTLQAQRIFAKAIVKDGVLDAQDIDLVNHEKSEIIRGCEALEYYPPKEGLQDVGGLKTLKGWLQLRAAAFTKEAREYGLPSPKGIALIGIPGTGKSLSAKMIGSLWHLPILRFDVGALYRPFIGQSEETARKALRLAEAVAPCVLWIDELEKAMSRGDLDGGTSSRVFGTILTWMQEKTVTCFVVATANNIGMLPPELLRRGRFDEIFFLDLPAQDERQEIFQVHLRKRNRSPENFDLEKLAIASQGYVGAEIEQAISDAMFVAFNQKREFITQDLVDSLKRLVPISVSQKDTLAALQSWLDEGRALSASGSGDGEMERLKQKIGF